MAVNTFVLAVDTAVSGSWVAAAAWNTALATKPPWPRGAGPQAPRSGSRSQQRQHWRRVCARCCSHVGTIPRGCCSSEAPQAACWVLAAHRSESCTPWHTSAQAGEPAWLRVCCISLGCCSLPYCQGYHCAPSSAKATLQSCFLTEKQESFTSADQSGFHYAAFYSDYASLGFATSQLR